MTRQQDTLAARAAADEWAAQHSLPPSGAYSGNWYVESYLGGWWPAGWPKWWAAYGITPGSIIGDDIVAHQYGSTPVDLDVMLDSEIVSAGGTQPVDDAERTAMQDTINGLVSALGLVCGDYMKPLTRKNAAAYVKTFVGQARAVCDQFGVNHA